MIEISYYVTYKEQAVKQNLCSETSIPKYF